MEPERARRTGKTERTERAMRIWSIVRTEMAGRKGKTGTAFFNPKKECNVLICVLF